MSPFKFPSSRLKRKSLESKSSSGDSYEQDVTAGESSTSDLASVSSGNTLGCTSPISTPQFPLNERYLDPNFLNMFKAAFSAKQSLKDNMSDAFIQADPFPVVVLRNIFQDSVPTSSSSSLNKCFLQRIKKEIMSLEFAQRSNDLYDFYQGTDLKHLKSSDYPAIAALRDNLFNSQFFSLVKKITGFEELDERVIDIAAQRYKKGGNLLCHDDSLGGRRIAFILYLVPPNKWTPEDGGHLDLLTHDSVSGLPTTVRNSILPVWNTLAFFEVTPTSYHQVREIMSKCGDERVSITGWFHGATPKGYVEEAARIQENGKQINVKINEISSIIRRNPNALENWISPEYLTPTSWSSIKDVFVGQSNISLQDFFRPDVYKAIMEGFDIADSLERNWALMGPPNSRRFYRLRRGDDLDSVFEYTDKRGEVSIDEDDEDLFLDCNITDSALQSPISGRASKTNSLSILDSGSASLCEEYCANYPKQLKRLDSFLRSMEFSYFLNQVTDAMISKNFHLDINKFTSRCYSLIHDHFVEPEGMDVIFFFPSGSVANESIWKDSHGGQVHYLAEEETILSVEPRPNSCTLVYRDEGVRRFTKYVKQSSFPSDSKIYQVSAVYEVK